MGDLVNEQVLLVKIGIVSSIPYLLQNEILISVPLLMQPHYIKKECSHVIPNVME